MYTDPVGSQRDGVRDIERGKHEYKEWEREITNKEEKVIQRMCGEASKMM
jgi:hypothetical protein